MDPNQILPLLSGLGISPSGIAIGMAILYGIQWWLSRRNPSPAPAPAPVDPTVPPAPDKPSGPLGLGLLDLLQKLLPLLLARKAAGLVQPYSAESTAEPTIEELYLDHVRKLLN